jgi:methyltransferase (TIGR00027 family)
VQRAEPSQTAKLAVIARGQHRLTYRQPWILDDPYALSLVGPAWEQLWAGLRAIFPDRVLEEAMSGIVTRSRYVEDLLEAGTFEQYVILGAGLDSFAWRRPDVLASTRVFEVDQPATQAWKRQRAEVMALPRSDRHVFAPVDFERETLDAGLASVGFDPLASTLFSWLAVIPYLTIGAMTLLSPTEVEELLTRCGLSAVDHLHSHALRERYLAGRDDVPPPYTTERVIGAALPR